MATATSLPPLRDGELLDQPEFHERYFAMPEDFRAELLEGRVCIMSPVHGAHSDVSPLVFAWLCGYVEQTPGAWCRSNGATILGPRNELQPAAALFVLPSHGGTVRHDSKGCLIGAPELVVEVADATESSDLPTKLKVYEQEGVSEYLVILIRSRAVRWYMRAEGRFAQIEAEQGVLKSHAFPGLWLDSEAMLARQPSPLMKTLRRGLADTSHERFAAELANRSLTGRGGSP